MFSDRPDRIVKTKSTADLVGNWTLGGDSFAMYAPNAVLVVDAATGEQDTPIIELFNPVYSFDKKTLKYDISSLEPMSINISDDFGESTLLIDSGALLQLVAQGVQDG